MGIMAFNDGLTVYDKNGHPNFWSRIQNSLGLAHKAVAIMCGSRDEFGKAISILISLVDFHSSLSLDYAAAQRNLGNSYSQRSNLWFSEDDLKSAIRAYRAALLVRTRERFPKEWFEISTDLGGELTKLGLASRSADQLLEAVEVFGTLEEVTDIKVVLRSWLINKNNLGYALICLDEVVPDKLHLTKALDHLSAGFLASHAHSDVSRRIAENIALIRQKQSSM
jgi:tetratricopeptide (TPR) repeat protein